MAAGLPSRIMRAEIRMLVSSTTRIRLCQRFPFGMAFSADLAHGFVDDALQLIRVGIRIALPDVLHGAMKHVPADGLLDEF